MCDTVATVILVYSLRSCIIRYSDLISDGSKPQYGSDFKCFMTISLVIKNLILKSSNRKNKIVLYDLYYLSAYKKDWSI